jgi:hypothetical protein
MPVFPRDPQPTEIRKRCRLPVDEDLMQRLLAYTDNFAGLPFSRDNEIMTSAAQRRGEGGWFALKGYSYPSIRCNLAQDTPDVAIVGARGRREGDVVGSRWVLQAALSKAPVHDGSPRGN